jgi:hypothetical protein
LSLLYFLDLLSESLYPELMRNERNSDFLMAKTHCSKDMVKILIPFLG